MANIPVNALGVVTTTSITGSFAGFTVVSGSFAIITGLKDANNVNLATTNWNIPVGITVPIYVTSASLSAGAILLYP